MNSLRILLVSMVVSGFAGSASAGLLARWAFDEGAGQTAFDDVGGFDGTLQLDSVLLAGGGVAGGQIDIGDGGFVVVGDVLDLAGNFTLQAWIRTQSSGGAVVLGRYEPPFQGGYALMLNDSNDGAPSEPPGSFHLYQSNTPQIHSGNQGLNDGEWHQIVAVRDSDASRVRLYVDGRRVPEADSLADFGNVSSTYADFLIGGITLEGEPERAYEGFLDEVRVWNTALGDATVKLFFDHPELVNPVLCGDANYNRSISASDAQAALRVSVGTLDGMDCAADANGNGAITAPDALLILRDSVGQQVTLACPACLAEELVEMRIEAPCTNEASPVCTATYAGRSAAIGGDPQKLYEVTLRIRGVIEQKTYVGGVQDGFFLTGGTPAADGYNVVSIATGDPAATYRLNAGTSGIQQVWELDTTRTITMRGGSLMGLTSDPLDGFQIANTDGSGQPVIPAGISPAPAAFPGQFVQIDVVGVKEKD
jgi:hypothetical protein